jgi:CHASE2 domain-containing sensor protein
MPVEPSTPPAGKPWQQLLPLLAGAVVLLLVLSGALQRLDNWFYDVAISQRPLSKRPTTPS